jgi:hypothetical protein
MNVRYVLAVVCVVVSFAPGCAEAAPPKAGAPPKASAPSKASAAAPPTKSELKWAQGVAEDFLNSLASGQIEQAEGLVSEQLLTAFTKSGKSGLREWLASNAAVRTLPERKLKEAELSPGGDEVSIVGNYASGGQDVTLSLRLAKQGGKGPWRVSYFNLAAKRAAVAVKPPATPAELADPLLGKLPEDFMVAAVTVSRGPKTSDVQLAADGSTTYLCDVVVNEPGRNVVLIVSGYEPTIWQIGHTRETKLVGVIITGYQRQAVVGLERSTAQAASTNELQGAFRPFHGNQGFVPETTALNKFAAGLVGKTVSAHGKLSSDGIFYVGEQPQRDSDVIRSEDKKIEDLAAKGSLPAGQRGLDQLVKQGFIRLAKQDDIDEWVAAAKEREANAGSGRQPHHYMHVGRTYVILKETSLPPGMSGGNSRSFIVPVDVPLPVATRQHNQFFIMDGSTTMP